MSVVVQQRGKLWVYGYRAFVLEIPNFDVEAFNLSIELTILGFTIMKRRKGESTYKSGSFLT